MKMIMKRVDDIKTPSSQRLNDVAEDIRVEEPLSYYVHSGGDDYIHLEDDVWILPPSPSDLHEESTNFTQSIFGAA